MSRFEQGLTRMNKGMDELFGRPPSRQSGDALSLLFEQRTGPAKRSTKDFLAAYSESPWLRAVTDRISTGVAMVEWFLEVDGEQFEGEHPLLDILRKGNTIQSGSGLIKTTQLHLDLTGDAYWLLDVNGAGVPVEAWILPPHWIEELPSVENDFKYIVRVETSSSRIEAPKDAVVRFTHPDPLNPYLYGSGTAKALNDEIETDEYASKHTKNWFFNSARPELIIQANNYTQENVNRLERQWLNRVQGYWKAHLPIFLRGDGLDIKQLSQTFEQMDLVKLRQNIRDMVMQVFGVSPEIFGVLESSNRATIEAADYLFSRWVVLPRLEFLKVNMNKSLVPLYDSRLSLNFVSPVREDKDRDIQLKKAAAWTMTMNEWREQNGLDSIGPEGDVYLIPLNMTLRKDLSEVSIDDLLSGV